MRTKSRISYRKQRVLETASADCLLSPSSYMDVCMAKVSGGVHRLCVANGTNLALGLREEDKIIDLGWKR